MFSQEENLVRTLVYALKIEKSFRLSLRKPLRSSDEVAVYTLFCSVRDCVLFPSSTTFSTFPCEISCEGMKTSFPYRFQCSVKKVAVFFYYSLAENCK